MFEIKVSVGLRTDDYRFVIFDKTNLDRFSQGMSCISRELSGPRCVEESISQILRWAAAAGSTSGCGLSTSSTAGNLPRLSIPAVVFNNHYKIVMIGKRNFWSANLRQSNETLPLSFFPLIARLGIEAVGPRENQWSPGLPEITNRDAVWGL
jgi:hypothetical protein